MAWDRKIFGISSSEIGCLLSQYLQTWIVAIYDIKILRTDRESKIMLEILSSLCGSNTWLLDRESRSQIPKMIRKTARLNSLCQHSLLIRYLTLYSELKCGAWCDRKMKNKLQIPSKIGSDLTQFRAIVYTQVVGQSRNSCGLGAFHRTTFSWSTNCQSLDFSFPMGCTIRHINP